MSWVPRVVSERLIGSRLAANYGRTTLLTLSPLRPRSSPVVYINLGWSEEQ